MIEALNELDEDLKKSSETPIVIEEKTDSLNVIESEKINVKKTEVNLIEENAKNEQIEKLQEEVHIEASIHFDIVEDKKSDIENNEEAKIINVLDVLESKGNSDAEIRINLIEENGESDHINEIKEENKPEEIISVDNTRGENSDITNSEEAEKESIVEELDSLEIAESEEDNNVKIDIITKDEKVEIEKAEEDQREVKVEVEVLNPVDLVDAETLNIKKNEGEHVDKQIETEIQDEEVKDEITTENTHFLEITESEENSDNKIDIKITDKENLDKAETESSKEFKIQSKLLSQFQKISSCQINKDKKPFISFEIKAKCFKNEVNEENLGRLNKIDSILLNKRDMENIIETNALLQHLGHSSDGLKLLSKAQGESIQNILKKVQVDQNMESAIVTNNSGHILSSFANNNSKINTIATVSNFAFKTAESFYGQIYSEKLEYLTLVFESKSIDIIDFNNIYLTTLATKDFSIIENSHLFNILKALDLINLNLEDPFLVNYENSIITNQDGEIFSNNKNKDIELISKTLVAMIENLKEFFVPVLNQKLKSIRLYSKEKMIVLQKQNDRTIILNKLFDKIPDLKPTLKEFIELQKVER